MDRSETDPFTAITVMNMGTLPKKLTSIGLVNMPGGLFKRLMKPKQAENIAFEFEISGPRLPLDLEPRDFWDFGYFHANLPTAEKGNLYIAVKYIESETERQELIRVG